MKSSSTTEAGPTRSTASSPNRIRRTQPRCAPPGQPLRSSAYRGTARTLNTRTPRANGTSSRPPAWIGQTPLPKTQKAETGKPFRNRREGRSPRREEVRSQRQAPLQISNDKCSVVPPASFLFPHPLRTLPCGRLALLLRGGFALGSGDGLRGRRRRGIACEAQRAQALGVGIDGFARRVIFGHGLLGVFGSLQLDQRVTGFLVRHIGSCPDS